MNIYGMPEKDVDQLSPLVLAFIGDAVYEVFVRSLIVSRGNAPVHKLHKESIAFVKAKAQCGIVRRIMDSLEPEEQDVVRRGRNAKSGTIPKNADVTEYKYATGFEAMIGYLYLKKRFKRLGEIFEMCAAKPDEREEKLEQPLEDGEV